MSLKTYRGKRDFRKTAEPRGKLHQPSSGRRFVVQKHASRRLHYDFRLEAEGVLKSWAVPKGPSTDPAKKRLAVQVEDHPLEYGDFEGEIEENQYGAGTVMVWDRGTWAPHGDWKEGWKEGKLNFSLKGKKLKGSWTLVRFKGGEGAGARNWLLIKSPDEEAKESSRYDITAAKPDSVKTGRSMEEIKAQSKGAVKKTGQGQEKRRTSRKKE
jgi:bifunctional non-homologous end joining protein LigD